MILLFVLTFYNIDIFIVIILFIHMRCGDIYFAVCILAF